MSAEHEAPRDPSPTQLFESYEERLKTLELKLNGLYVLLERVKKLPKAFDEEDQQHIQAHIDQCEKEQKYIQHEWKYRESLYHNTFKTMQQALTERASVLEKTDVDTGVLEHNPELMDLFVRKQTKLTAMAQAMRDKLLEEEDHCRHHS